MPEKIFIGYRREDVAGYARGIRAALATSSATVNVFVDVDKLLAGQRFDWELGKALDASDVPIVVIGPRWMDLLETKTAGGEPRAHLPYGLRNQQRPVAFLPAARRVTLGTSRRAYP